MKKTILILMLALLIGSIGAAARPMVTASLLKYEPAPAEQGNTFEAWVQLSNEGTQADRVALKFIPEYPFSLPEGEEAVREIGTLSATEDVVQRFNIYVDVNAPNGEKDLKFQYKFDSDNWAQFEPPVVLQTQNAALIVKEYRVSPEKVAPGQQAQVTMTLENIGRIGVKNVDVSIDLGDKFSTIGTGSVKRIRSIGPGQEDQVSFMIASDTSTEVKLYSLPVEIEYQDERNKEYSSTAKISLAMNAEPEIDMIVDSTDFKSRTAPGEVGVKIINKGVVDIKYTTLRLLSSPDYEILSPSSLEYVGNLDSDDFETVTYLIKPLKEQPTLMLQLDYKDPYNMDFQQQFAMPLKILTPEDLGKGKSPWGTIIVVLIIAGIAIYFWRRKRKKKR